MNREIKFRVWHLNLKRFVTGYEDKNSYEELYSDSAGLFFGALNQLKDDKDCILQQFTGLKDECGKEIYEGDILKNEGHFAYGVVSFTEAKFIVNLKDSKIYYDLYELFDGLCQENYPEVIGNIFENPELCAK